MVPNTQRKLQLRCSMHLRLLVIVGLTLQALSFSPSHVFGPSIRNPVSSSAFDNQSLQLPIRQSFNKHPVYLPTTRTFRKAVKNYPDDDESFNPRMTASLVAGQSSFIGIAAIIAAFIGTPNFGFGPGIDFTSAAIQQGILYTIPLFVLAKVLDLVEDDYPALQDVTKATQRSVISILGETPKPLIALVVSIALGLAAGFGEEMLFRGVLQYELANKFGSIIAVSLASIIFGALHAVTPLYAALAGLASIYFGTLYDVSGNLAVPIITHALYDVGALLWAHWTVTKMTKAQRLEIINWEGPREGGPIDPSIL